MSQLLDIKKWYITNFNELDNKTNGGIPPTVKSMRKDAIDKFAELDFPTVKDEEWKYTNITPLLKHNFLPVSRPTEVNSEMVSDFLFDELEHSLLVFVDGIYSMELSKIKKLPKGVIIQNLGEAMTQNTNLIENHLGKYADYKNHVFTALSSAYTKDGAFVYIPDGEIVEDSIHILFITASKDEILTQPRNLYIAGKNSQATIIEHHVSLNESIYLTNSVTEIFTDQNAVLDHIKLQEESKKAFHISRTEVDQERSSTFSSNLISLGGDISRNDFNTRFNDEGGDCLLNGLYMIEGTQLFDAHTIIDHAKPHCDSHEHYKGILDDRSRGVFNGKVMVRKDAQKTNAFQENNNIILSTEALVNTKPQLEIFADDVKCSHGATIGQLDEESLFYLKSRGIGEDIARGILIHAFASEVIRFIKVEPVRNYIEDILTNKFNTE